MLKLSSEKLVSVLALHCTYCCKHGKWNAM